MRRYWIEQEKLTSEHAVLDGNLFHHITDVCRLQVGDKFELLCGDQKAYLVEIETIGKKTAVAKHISFREIKSLPRPWIHLAISVPKVATLESVLEKSVELGVKSVIPFVSEFSFVRAKNSPIFGKIPRWKKIIQSATEQSGRGDVMVLEEPVALEELLKKINQNSNACGLFSYEGPAALDIKTALSKINPKEEIFIFVGSEGGFSARETELFRTYGLESTSLGEQVLRVETACITLLSIIKYHCDLMK